MLEKEKIFHNSIASLAQEIPSQMLESVSISLNKLENHPNIDDLNPIIKQLNVPSARKQLKEVLDIWLHSYPHLTPQTIGWMLKTASVVDSRIRSDQHIELVWSGPTSKNETLRRTDQVLLDLIRSSHKSLLIVSFIVYKIPEIKQALLEAISRRVKVTLIVQFSEETEGAFNNMSSLGDILRVNTDIFVWPSEKTSNDDNERSGIMHVKCAVADLNIVLLSSANLTYNALYLNMELGVQIKGGDFPKKIQKHFEELIGEGILIPFAK